MLAGAELLTVLEKLDRGKMTETIEVEYDKILNYIRKNVHRMDYPTYLRRGWQMVRSRPSSPRARPSSTNASAKAACAGVRKAPTGSPTYVLCTAAIPISGTDIGTAPPERFLPTKMTPTLPRAQAPPGHALSARLCLAACAKFTFLRQSRRSLEIQCDAQGGAWAREKNW